MKTAILSSTQIIWSSKQDDVGGKPQAIETFAAKAEGFGSRTLIVPKLVHGSARAVVDAKTTPKRPSVDAVMTNDLNCALGLYVADCLPIVCFDRKTHALALIHGGWRSLIQNIVPLTLQQMQIQFGVNPRDLQVWIGPSLHDCCNILEHTRVFGQFHEWKKHLVEKKGNMHLNLHGVTQDQLASAGVPARNIADSGICTYHQRDEYYSYRRQINEREDLQGTPKMSVVVWMEQ